MSTYSTDSLTGRCLGYEPSLLISFVPYSFKVRRRFKIPRLYPFFPRTCSKHPRIIQLIQTRLQPTPRSQVPLLLTHSEIQTSDSLTQKHLRTNLPPISADPWRRLLAGRSKDGLMMRKTIQ